MREKWERIKKPLCTVIMAICLFFLLGCTGTAERGGDLTVYLVQGTVLLAITIITGLIGGLFS